MVSSAVIFTAVGVEGFAWCRHEGTINPEGSDREFEICAIEMGATAPEPKSDSNNLDGEAFKVIADNLVLESGIIPILHCCFAALVMEGKGIKGIITESKAGREAIRSGRVIESTRVGDVAWRSGAPMHKTPKEEMMAASVMFSISGVERQGLNDDPKANSQTHTDWESSETTGGEDAMFSRFLFKPIEQAMATGLISSNLDRLSGTWGALYQTEELTYLNLVHLAGYDGTDSNALTEFEIEDRRQVVRATEAPHRFHPGVRRQSYRFGMALGIRDTYQIDAIYNMTELDVCHQIRFYDSIGIFPGFVDGYGILILPTTGRYFQRPYSALVPNSFFNLLAAGRITAATRLVTPQDAIRCAARSAARRRAQQRQSR